MMMMVMMMVMFMMRMRMVMMMRMRMVMSTKMGMRDLDFARRLQSAVNRWHHYLCLRWVYREFRAMVKACWARLSSCGLGNAAGRRGYTPLIQAMCCKEAHILVQVGLCHR